MDNVTSKPLNLRPNEFLLVKGHTYTNTYQYWLTWYEGTESFHFDAEREAAYRFKDYHALITLIGELHLFHASTARFWLYLEIWSELPDGTLAWVANLHHKDQLANAIQERRPLVNQEEK